MRTLICLLMLASTAHAGEVWVVKKSNYSEAPNSSVWVVSHKPSKHLKICACSSQCTCSCNQGGECTCGHNPATNPDKIPDNMSGFRSNRTQPDRIQTSTQWPTQPATQIIENCVGTR